MKVMFLGDTHGNLGWIKSTVAPLAAHHDVKLILQLGDWGFWWPGHDTDTRLNTILSQIDVPMWFIDGNHDNHPRLRNIGEDGEVGSHLRYLKRGTRFEIDSWKFLALGGAYSIDKMYRTEGKSWWREEEITYAEAMEAIDSGPADIMLTHDKPLGVRLDWDRKDIPECWPNQKIITEVANEVQPKWLFHGHVHFRQTSTLDLPGGKLCRVESLNCDDPKDQYGWTTHPSDSIIIMETSGLKSITADGKLMQQLPK